VTFEEIMKGRNHKPFNQGEILDWFIRIAGILEYLHSQSPPVIYRDVKPSNVILSEDGKIFLLDFGIAKIFQPQAKGTLIGTPGYAPPEQYKGYTDERSDVYSLGVMMHYFLTGIDPTSDEAGVFSREEIRKMNPGVTEDLENFVTSMIEMEPAKRPGNMKDVRERLEEIVNVKKVAICHSEQPALNLFQGSEESKFSLISRSFAIAQDDRLSDNASFTHPQLIKAISEGDQAEVERLISLGADVNARSKTNDTPLHWAASNGLTKIAEILTSRGADVNVKGELGYTPLHAAVISGQIEASQMLTSRGADVNAKDDDGNSPLQLEIKQKRRIKIIKMLISGGADVNTKDNNGNTILHNELSKDCTKIAEMLIAKDADVNARDNCGDTLLHKAASHGYLEFAELLISRGADVNAKNPEGETPLQNAIRFGHKRIAEMFIP
jgi:ankyrin repeat protein